MPVSSSEQIADFDVLIVGSGMVGATLACALADTSLRIGIIDSQPLLALNPPEHEPAEFEPRVSAISPASRWIFDQLGVWKLMAQQRHCPYTDMHVWEADGTGSIHFAAADVHVQELGYIFENSLLLAALHEELRRSPHITVLPPATVTGLAIAPVAGMLSTTGITLADNTRISCRLLVGADGANSKIRQLAQFPVKEWDYQHHAIVTTVRTELPHAHTARQRFMDTGILAFLPMHKSAHNDEVADQFYCSIVWSVVPERALQLLEMSDVDFARALQEGLENRLGKVEWVDKRLSLPLRQRHAPDYVKNNIALIGDAAHSIHPLAGLGVNLGLLDAWSLAEQIKKAIQQRRGISELRILRRYQRERIGHNLAMMWLMEGFKRLFADQPLALRWLRNTGMSQLDNLPMIKNQIMRQAMGLKVGSERD